MTKKILCIIAGLIGFNPAQASTEQTQNLTDDQKLQISRALKVLQKAGTLVAEENGSLGLDQNTLTLLEEEGLIERENVRSHSICINP